MYGTAVVYHTQSPWLALFLVPCSCNRTLLHLATPSPALAPTPPTLPPPPAAAAAVKLFTHACSRQAISRHGLSRAPNRFPLHYLTTTPLTQPGPAFPSTPCPPLPHRSLCLVSAAQHASQAVSIIFQPAQIRCMPCLPLLLLFLLLLGSSPSHLLTHMSGTGLRKLFVSLFCFVSFCLLSAALEAALAHPHACVCLSLCLSVCVAVPVCVCACVHVRPASLLCLAPLSCHFSSLHNIFQVFDVSFAPNAHQFLDSLPASCSFSLPSFSSPPPSYSPPTPTLFCQLFIFCIIRGGNSIKT